MNSTLQLIALAEVLFCWLAWSSAFIAPTRQAAGQKELARDPASKWGILMVFLAFACLWAYIRPVGFAKSPPALIAAMFLAPPSVALVWAATRHLGKQWRYQAAVSQDHVLIQTGPYRWIRHPIYASMFGMLLATGFAYTWWPLFLAAIVFFVLGTEIRIRAEDRLLARHFGGTFAAYRSRTRAYIPFIR